MSIIVSTLTRERVSWQITPRVLAEALAASGDEAKRAFDAMMGMKIDVAAIKAARLTVRCRPLVRRLGAPVGRSWMDRLRGLHGADILLCHRGAGSSQDRSNRCLSTAESLLCAGLNRARPGSAPSASTQSG